MDFFAGERWHERGDEVGEIPHPLWVICYNFARGKDGFGGQLETFDWVVVGVVLHFFIGAMDVSFHQWIVDSTVLSVARDNTTSGDGEIYITFS